MITREGLWDSLQAPSGFNDDADEIGRSGSSSHDRLGTDGHLLKHTQLPFTYTQTAKGTNFAPNIFRHTPHYRSQAPIRPPRSTSSCLLPPPENAHLPPKRNREEQSSRGNCHTQTESLFSVNAGAPVYMAVSFGAVKCETCAHWPLRPPLIHPLLVCGAPRTNPTRN